jgi:hypothetical protein
MSAMLEQLFPDLRTTGYQEKSPVDAGYNCVAWAAGHNDRWWEAVPGYYWPDPTARGAETSTVVEMFKTLGFVKSDNDSLEAGFEKIAIYVQGPEYTHVARQLPNGQWASKIGALEDIEHASLDGLVGTNYGIVEEIMKRPITPGT